MPEGTQSYLGVTAVVVSTTMRELIQRIEKIARTSATVLITGETGSGKEIVARAIHHYSFRSAKPWVDFNCAALPEHLVESELFGHEKGAFSGADAMKPGLFELAHTGTLFLDEVGELEARMQVKLLRVLDAVPYYRVGGQKKVSADARIIAATNQDLEAAVKHGRFRSDLYHRLNQCPVRVPPLRERRADIVPIAQHFLRQHSAEACFSDDAKAALERYAWPGNVREVRNVVTTAVIEARSYEITADELEFPEDRARGRAFAADGGLDGLEREAILEALQRTGGHHQRTADLLGISRRTLSRKLKIYRGEAAEDEIHVC